MMQELIDKLRKQQIEAYTVIEDAVKQSARKLLRENPELDEFISAMGGIVITAKKGGRFDLNTCETDEEYEAIREFVNSSGFIEESAFPEFFSDMAKLEQLYVNSTHSLGVRFTAYGPEITDW